MTASSNSMEWVSIDDWALALTADIAEAYSLPVATSQALADDIRQTLRSRKLLPKADAPPLLSVYEQALFNAAMSRMVKAERTGEGIRVAGMRPSEAYHLTAEMWAGYVCGWLARAFEITPAILLSLVSDLSRVFESYDLSNRPLQVLDKPILAEMAPQKRARTGHEPPPRR